MIIKAPWSDKQVSELCRWQVNRSIHPFTCARCSHSILIPTNDGWRCPLCDYRQDWCHDLMFRDHPEQMPLEEMLCDQRDAAADQDCGTDGFGLLA
jgi:hypothetical protein